jgi:hypothetical protein
MTATWNPIPFALVMIVLCVAMYAIPSLIDGYRNYRKGLDLARQIDQEETARKALEKLSR